MKRSRRESMAVQIQKAKSDRDWEKGQIQMVALALAEVSDVIIINTCDMISCYDILTVTTAYNCL
jgi:hypothetical protein